MASFIKSVHLLFSCLIFRLSLDFILFRATISLYMFSDFINAGLVCLAADANYPKGFRAVDIPLITKATSDFVGLIGHSFSAIRLPNLDVLFFPCCTLLALFFPFVVY
ncbi:hypothetical protein ACJX0J_039077 [Zea mays]